MTRKRFIKLLMSQGQQRNKAQAIAFYYNARNIPYAIAYTEWCLELVKSAFENLGKTAEKTARAFSECVCAIKNMASNVAVALGNDMDGGSNNAE